MTKISNRLQSLVDFVEKNDRLVDVGCDHGLLSIYLVENNLCNKVIASDVNKNALNNAISNIKKRKLNIETILSDGIDNVPMDDINTILISGMGTSTILHILNDKKKLKNIDKLIIQSNNDLEMLRNGISEKGYYLKKETVLNDKGKWYVSMLFIKSNKKNTLKELKYGFLNNNDYNNYLLLKQKSIVNRIPFKSFMSKLREYKKYRLLKKAINK